jgi:hypothetical protein
VHESDIPVVAFAQASPSMDHAIAHIQFQLDNIFVAPTTLDAGKLTWLDAKRLAVHS